MNTRTLLIALAFSVTATAAVAGLTLRAETKEAGVVENACAVATWPYIPAKCLDAAPGRAVRVVTGDIDDGSDLAAMRPTVATQ